MKFTKYAAMTAAVAMLAACSSDDNLGSQEPAPGQNPGQTGTAYVNLTLNLPTTKGSKASFDEYNDGDEEEYAVTNGTLLLFSSSTPAESFDATTEGSAVYQYKMSLTQFSDQDGSDDITTKYNFVSELKDFNKGEQNWYALVLLNAEDGQFPALVQGSTTFSEWSRTPMKSMVIKVSETNYYTMSNAPLVTADSKTPVTLVPVTIYSSESEATQGTSENIYVQRGVAKITLSKAGVQQQGANALGNLTVTNDSEATVSIYTWTPDVVNKTTYPVQIASDGTSTVDYTIGTHFYDVAGHGRVFWGVDPNYTKVSYSSNATSSDITDFFRYTDLGYSDADSYWVDPYNKAFVLENTMEAEAMYQGESTRLIFWAEYTVAENDATDKSLVKIGEKIYGKTQFAAAVDAVKGDRNIDEISFVDVTASNGKVTFEQLIKGSDAAEVIADLKTSLNPDTESFDFYKDGICYYTVIVRHFDDDEAGWADGEEYSDAKHLGRYGVVRNNWYDIAISSVARIGSPVIPEPDPNKPDDDEKSFINFTINIMAWAKRSNEYVLQ